MKGHITTSGGDVALKPDQTFKFNYQCTQDTRARQIC